MYGYLIEKKTVFTNDFIFSRVRNTVGFRRDSAPFE